MPLRFQETRANGWKQIIGAPAFFPTVWGWIKRWFDPITTSKIFILSNHDLLPTLESFIDPANIPKKYGGQLDYTCGDNPVLDPAMAKVLTFEEICTISTQYPATATEINGHAEPVLVRKELLTAPTETDLPSTIDEEALSSQTEPAKASDDAYTEGNEAPIVQEGKLIPASRPEPVTFVTATEGVDTLNEKTGNLALNGNGPHQARCANQLDPNLATNGDVATENAHQHHSAGDVTDPAVGGGVEEADAAHAGANHGARGLVENVEGKVGITA